MDIPLLTRKILEKHTDMSTGSTEIILPGFVDNHIESEHISRYLFASSRVKGVVLDAGSGSCYGTSILGRSGYAVALDVQGDLLSYGKRFCDLSLHDVVQADARCSPFRERGFDGVVSLETLEHLSDPRKFIMEADRCLKKSGLLLLSTPNKLYTSPFCSRALNPYHLREFYYGELTRLVKKPFVLTEVYGQERISVAVLVRRIVSSLFKYLLTKSNFSISTIDDLYFRVRNRIQRVDSASVSVDLHPPLVRMESLGATSNFIPYKDILMVLKKRA